MTRRAPLRLAVAFALCAPLTTHADDTKKDFGRRGIYLQAGAVYAVEGISHPGGLDVEDSWGGDGRVGYRVGKHLAVELDYQQYADFNVSADSGPVETDVGDIDGYALTANAKGYAGAGRLQPYVLLALGFSDFSVDDDAGLGISESETEVVFRLGGGVDGYITNNVALFLEMSGDVTGDNRVAPLTFGVLYRF